MIDLNADLGEGMGGEEDILAIVTSANIACGGHAGSRRTMRETAERAGAAGVAIGAHPSYPDREGFGRRRVTMPVSALRESLAEQVGALREITAEAGHAVRYVKPHGALYHDALEDGDPAAALVDVAAAHRLPLLLAPQARFAPIWELAHARGIEIYAEGFADRTYRADGRLLARSEPGALIQDPERAAAQALQLARGAVATLDGKMLDMSVRSLCVHSDTPGALNVARAVRAGLTAAQVPIRAWSLP